jgi:hypothetical protein
VLLENNLFWDASGKSINFTPINLSWQGKDIDAMIAGLDHAPRTDLQQWQRDGKDLGSLVADPLFEGPTHYDFRLKTSSPGSQIGFIPFDASKAGVYGDAAWIKLAKGTSNPAP